MRGKRTEDGLAVRFPWRPVEVGSGAGRSACFRVIAAGHDQVLASTVVYGLAEGFSRGAGQPPRDPMRFHNGVGRNAGSELPEGLGEDHLVETARATLAEPDLFEGRTIEDIERICIEVGMAMRADAMPLSAW